jgi:hypothetical protein
LEEEASSVQDEEVLADRDNRQGPEDLVDGEFDSAYLELASSRARLSQMHMVAATLSCTLWMINLPRSSVQVGSCGERRESLIETDLNEIRW